MPEPQSPPERPVASTPVGSYDPLAGPTVEVPRALLRDAMTALYRASGDDTLLALLEPYAYPDEPSEYVRPDARASNDPAPEDT